MKFHRAEKRDARKVLVYPAVAGLAFGGSNEPLTTSYTDRSRFEIPLTGNGQLLVLLAVTALGGGGLTGISVLIEFWDSDAQEWFPSKEGAVRTANEASHTWDTVGTGFFLLASRAEPTKMFTKARVSFKAAGGPADGTTVAKATYMQDSAKVPDWGRD